MDISVPDLIKIYNVSNNDLPLFLAQVGYFLRFWEKWLEGRRPKSKKSSLPMGDLFESSAQQIGTACSLFGLRFQYFELAHCVYGDKSGLDQRYFLDTITRGLRILRESVSPNPDIGQIRTCVTEATHFSGEFADSLLLVHAPLGSEPAPLNLCGWRGLIRRKHPAVHIEARLLLEDPPAVRQAPAATAPAVYLTGSQRLALDRLRQFHILKLKRPRIQGIDTRPIPLLVGPSGVGKSHLVKIFSEQAGLPLLDLNCGTWLVTGGRSEMTSLRQLRRMVEQYQQGVLFLDEIDKMNGESDWGQAIRQEVFALLDGRTSSFEGWTESTQEAFRRNWFLIGAGTWQSLFREGSKTTGFGKPESFGPKQPDLERQTQIPEELLFRFNANVIYLESFTERELSERIIGIRNELKFPKLERTELQTLTRNAFSSGRVNRWLEAYVSSLVVSHL